MARVPRGMNAVIRTSQDLFVQDGEIVHGYSLHFPNPEDFEPYRSGYRCLKCHEVQDEPFPEVCKAVWRGEPQLGIPETRCGFQMRAEQMKQIEGDFAGYEDLWPNRNEPDREREAWQKTQSGILVP